MFKKNQQKQTTETKPENPKALCVFLLKIQSVQFVLSVAHSTFNFKQGCS